MSFYQFAIVFVNRTGMNKESISHEQFGKLKFKRLFSNASALKNGLKNNVDRCRGVETNSEIR